MAFSRDLRFGLRRLLSAPGYTIAAVATLALAIGASTAIFSAVYSVLLKPMPIRDPGSLVVGWGTSAALSMRVIELSYLQVRDIGVATPAVGNVASMSSSFWTAVLDGAGEPVKVPTTGVSGNFFELLGAVPRLGRMIRPDDDTTKSSPVMVISHGLWARQFGSDPNIIGRRVQLDQESHEIIGVMPASFNYPQGTEAWRSAAQVIGAPIPGGNPNPLMNVGVMLMIGRLNTGVTPEAALAEWTRANAQVLEGSPGPRYDIVVTPFLDHQMGPARQAMWVLFGAVGVLLLIACANVSGLMLTRVSLRNHEDAIRSALGGSRAAIGRLWAAETIWLTVLGGGLGLLTCQLLIGMIVALAPGGIPRLDEVTIDIPVALFSITVMTIATLLCGAAPIRHASIRNLVETLNDGSRTVAGGRTYRTRSTLLVIQIGLAVVLLVGAGLVVRSFGVLRALDFGFARDGVLLVKVEPRDQSQPVNTWIMDFLPQVAALGEVESVGGVYVRPLEFGSIGHGTWAVAEGQLESAQTASSNPIVNYHAASVDYFKAMRIPLVRGRLFTDDDRAGGPRVALVSESTAAAFFPGQDPIGKRIKAASFDDDRNPDGAWRTIVGVVGNVRYKGVHEMPLDMYDPPAQGTRGSITSLVVRLKPGHEGQALAVAAAIQTEARQRDPRALVSGIGMLDDVVNRELAPWRFSAWVFALFAGLSFAMAMLGLFSLVSLDVANRRHEFAIRVAVGATGGDIVRGVLRSAGARAALGIVGGVLVAAFVTRSLQGLLFGVTLGDGITYGSVIALVLGVVVVASYVPARRAGATNPLPLLHRG
jgi:putative ABC transport system permease protein